MSRANAQLSPLIVAPPVPEIIDFVTIGFNTTTRYLEQLAKGSVPTSLQHILPVGLPRSKGPGQESEETRGEAVPEPLAAVFVPRSDQSSLLHSHLPVLIQVASPETCLIALPKGAEARLSAALRIPRVGLLGMKKNAPSAAALLNFIKENVPAVQVPWIQEAAAARYLPVEINVIETTAPLAPQKSGHEKANN